MSDHADPGDETYEYPEPEDGPEVDHDELSRVEEARLRDLEVTDEAIGEQLLGVDEQEEEPEPEGPVFIGRGRNQPDDQGFIVAWWDKGNDSNFLSPARGILAMESAVDDMIEELTAHRALVSVGGLDDGGWKTKVELDYRELVLAMTGIQVLGIIADGDNGRKQLVEILEKLDVAAYEWRVFTEEDRKDASAKYAAAEAVNRREFMSTILSGLGFDPATVDVVTTPEGTMMVSPKTDDTPQEESVTLTPEVGDLGDGHGEL